MSFDPAHLAAVAWMPDTGAIVESANGETPAVLPVLSGNPTLVGYTNVPQASRALNNRKGYAAGAAGAAYTARGRIQPQVNFQIRLGSLPFLSNCFRPSEDELLPYIAIFVIVKGRFTLVYRKCKCATVDLMFGEGGEGGGGELTATPTMWAMTVQDGPILSPTPSQLRALGTPLFWHDVRQYSIGGADYRKELSQQQWTYSNNLEYKNCRPNFTGGDSAPLSRTAYEILEHHITVTGQTTLHQRANRNLIDGAANAQDWGNVAIRASDRPVVGNSGRNYLVTATDVVPTDETMNGGESSAQITHSIPTQASNLLLSLT